jgi:peptidyl-dipeptidase A
MFQKSFFVLTFAMILSFSQNLSAQAIPLQEIPPPTLPNKTLESADAQWFIAQVNHDLKTLYAQSANADWQYMTDIRPEHEKQSSIATEKYMAYLAGVIPLVPKFDGVVIDPYTRRQLDILRRSTTLPAPQDVAQRSKLAEIATAMQGHYGSAKACHTIDGKSVCKDLTALEADMRKVDQEPVIRQAWIDWHDTAKSIKDQYETFVSLANIGAQRISYENLGVLWKSQYDMPAQDFEAMTLKMWDQVKPLYEALHCHVRSKLKQKYPDLIAQDGLMPAHLFGNMWAQDWGALYDWLAPYPDQPSIDVDRALVEKKLSPLAMVKIAENAFTSLGLAPLPKTFWERSLFLKPEGKDVVCHASAWDVNLNGDLRIKMCIKVDHEDLITLHHELGHNYYNYQYYMLPVLLQEGANDGFHEGIGDTLALSVTPAYLHKIGILDTAVENEKAILNQQMKMGLEKISFLPFGLLVDQWRWQVFGGQAKKENYNQSWWQLRAKYQGLKPPVERGADAFDAGAKYHVPGNTPYMRYFLAHILQFQFHQALCKIKGHTGPLYTCSIFGSKEAGDQLQKMLALGALKPWPLALAVLTGSTEMSAEPILAYFKPLMDYLKVQNANEKCGWTNKHD